jgi:hypothetical protein
MDNFCIIEDDDMEFNSNIHLEFSYKEIDEWKHKWNPNKYVDRGGKPKQFGYVTYRVINESESFPNNEFEDKALSIALRQWGLRTADIRFKRIRDVSIRADIEMRFVKREDDKLFKDRPTTLAYAYFPTKNTIGGDITFNDSVLWSTNGESVNAHIAKPDQYGPDTKTKLKTYNIIHTLLHECGHAIGLKHCQEHKECIMYPYYNGNVTLHHHDVQRIQAFYGKRGLSKRIISYFRKRMQRKWS